MGALKDLAVVWEKARKLDLDAPPRQARSSPRDICHLRVYAVIWRLQREGRKPIGHTPVFYGFARTGANDEDVRLVTPMPVEELREYTKAHPKRELLIRYGTPVARELPPFVGRGGRYFRTTPEAGDIRQAKPDQRPESVAVTAEQARAVLWALMASRKDQIGEGPEMPVPQRLLITNTVVGGVHSFSPQTIDIKITSDGQVEQRKPGEIVPWAGETRHEQEGNSD